MSTCMSGISCDECYCTNDVPKHVATVCDASLHIIIIMIFQFNS